MAKESLLIRYGVISEVARFTPPEGEPLARGQAVVVRTHRGWELGTVLEKVRDVPVSLSPHQHEPGASTRLPTGRPADDEPDTPAEATVAVAPEVAPDGVESQTIRAATDEDRQLAQRLREEAQAAFGEWAQRIQEWKLDLELLDLEWTLDRKKLILYVLAPRGPDSTKLALFAAARGTPVEVQPVDAEGLVTLPKEGGCGSGGCGCH